MARVLVVDDNRDTVDTMVELLRAIGHESRGCYGGQEALDCVAEYDPDAVLMDLSMPGIDGLEAAKAIRERRGTRCPMLIAITGEHEQFLDRMSRERTSFDCYLLKPPDTKVLINLLAKAERST
jgi:CheY-like chemotaxis protein